MNRALENLSHPISVASKLSLSIALFFIAAKILGPEQYGYIAKIFTYGLIIGQLIEYGASQKIIREAANSQQRLELHIWSNLFNKTPALLATAAAALLAFIFTKEHFDSNLLYIIGYFACNSIIDLLLAALRAKQKNITESIASTTINTTTIIVSIYYLTQNGVNEFCLSLFITRAFLTILLTTAILKGTVKSDIAKSISQIPSNIKESFNFAIDSISSSLFPTATLIALSTTLTPTTFGQIQLFQKIVQGCNTLSMITSQKYLPILAKYITTPEYRKHSSLFFRSTIILSIIAIAPISLLSILHEHIGITESYETFLIIAMLVITRYQAAYQGISLVIEQGARAKSRAALLSGATGTLLIYYIATITQSINLIIITELLLIATTTAVYAKLRKL